MKLVLSLLLVYLVLAVSMVVPDLGIAWPMLLLGMNCHRHAGASGVVLASILGLCVDGLGQGALGPCVFAYAWIACAWQPWLSVSPRLQAIVWPAGIAVTTFCDQVYRWSIHAWLDQRIGSNEFVWKAALTSSFKTAALAIAGFVLYRGLVDIVRSEQSRLLLENNWRRISDQQAGY